MSAGRIARHVGPLIFVSFVLTFLAARLIVVGVMLGWLPNLYLYVRDTHVHHLNYGIILLACAGGYTLLGRPRGRGLLLSGALYGVGLALVVDEFAIWMRLGGPYWQWSSFAAVLVVGAALGLLGYAPLLGKLRAWQWAVGVLLCLVMVAAGALHVDRVREFADRRINPILERIEAGSPP